MRRNGRGPKNISRKNLWSNITYNMRICDLKNKGCLIGCINFIFLGNIKNRQPTYASLGSLEDPNFFFFFCPQNQFQLAPQSLVLLENSTELISNFFQFFFFEKGSGTYKRTLKKIWFWNLFFNFFLSP